MTVEDAYAEPVARKKRKDRAFTFGILAGIAAGVTATLLLNRAAEQDTFLDDTLVVELQPAIIPPDEQPTTEIAFPAMPATDGGTA